MRIQLNRASIYDVVSFACGYSIQMLWFGGGFHSRLEPAGGPPGLLELRDLGTLSDPLSSDDKYLLKQHTCLGSERCAEYIQEAQGAVSDGSLARIVQNTRRVLGASVRGAGKVRDVVHDAAISGKMQTATRTTSQAVCCLRMHACFRRVRSCRLRRNQPRGPEGARQRSLFLCAWSLELDSRRAGMCMSCVSVVLQLWNRVASPA